MLAVFPKVYDITAALLKSEIDGAFFDSFMITAHLDLIKDHPGLRVERTIEHPVMYGMVLAGNSSKMEACARRYVENYPRKVFQRIALHLKPLKVRHSNLWFRNVNNSKKFQETLLLLWYKNSARSEKSTSLNAYGFAMFSLLLVGNCVHILGGSPQHVPYIRFNGAEANSGIAQINWHPTGGSYFHTTNYSHHWNLLFFCRYRLKNGRSRGVFHSPLLGVRSCFVQPFDAHKLKSTILPANPATCTVEASY